MANGSDSKRRRLIDRGVKEHFLLALRGGAHRDAAAAQVGFSAQALYGARRRDPLFGLGWRWALELSAADERQRERAAKARQGDFAAPDGGAAEIAPNNKRALQKHRVRRLRFGAMVWAMTELFEKQPPEPRIVML